LEPKNPPADVKQFHRDIRTRRFATTSTLWPATITFLPALAVAGNGVISVAGHLCSRELRAMADAV